MNLNWTKVGEVYSRDNQEKLAQIFKQMRWLKPGEQIPSMVAIAINGAIREFRIPATRIAISHDMVPFGLYCIEGKYKNGTARIFLVDDGTTITPIASGLIE